MSKAEVAGSLIITGPRKALCLMHVTNFIIFFLQRMLFKLYNPPAPQNLNLTLAIARTSS